MAQDVLTVAWKFMRKRQFATAIKLLEGRVDVYEGNFEYYLLTGIACLYVGDFGAAGSYFQKARQIKLTDSRLLLGQAAIYLRRGDTERALQYYMEVKENDASNKTAQDAIEFIRSRGDFDTICRWVDTGRIKQFYPPLGPNPSKVTAAILFASAFAISLTLVLLFVPHNDYSKGARKNISELSLTVDEKNNSQEKDLSGQTFSYILSEKQITGSYNNALKYFQSKRDNMVQIEVNRILNSNAALSIKQKAAVLSGYLDEPTFDTITDNPSYDEVEKEPALYMDCWVSWGGKIANAVENPDGTYTCQLLVGYETGKNVEGYVTVKFNSVPNIATDQPVKILGKISSEDKKIFLKGKSVYQNVKDGML